MTHYTQKKKKKKAIKVDIVKRFNIIQENVNIENVNKINITILFNENEQSLYFALSITIQVYTIFINVQVYKNILKELFRWSKKIFDINDSFNTVKYNVYKFLNQILPKLTIVSDFTNMCI